VSTDVIPVHGTSLELSRDQVDLLKRTIAKDANDDEFALFLHLCKRSGLDPFARQIYAIKRKGQLVIQTSIDGYRLIADRTGLYAGSAAPLYDVDDAEHPNRALVTVYKLVAGAARAFEAEARWSEYAQVFSGKLGDMWEKMPYLMLGKCAEALALRKAFPQELSGLYTHDEMGQAESDARPVRTVPVMTEVRHPEPPPTPGPTLWRETLTAHGHDPRLPEGLKRQVATVTATTADSKGLALAGAVLDWLDKEREPGDEDDAL
jgi:phage recombination protein Bet